jgi:endonuclease YncB( thermonuclease family)
MSKPWNPGRKAVELRSSRIRREPVRPSRIRRDPVRHEKKVQAASEEREIWYGVAGVLLIAVALAVAIVGISVATIFNGASSSAKTVRFGQCLTAYGPDCVVDGEIIHVAGEEVQIAGIDAPEIQGAHCAQERDRGIDAAVQLADLLNSGEVTVSDPFRDDYGRIVRKVQVKGEDVAENLIGADAVRRYDGTKQDWCE